MFPLGIVSQGETNGGLPLFVVSHFRSPNTEKGRNQSLSLPYPPCQPTLTDRPDSIKSRTPNAALIFYMMNMLSRAMMCPSLSERSLLTHSVR